MTGFSNIQVPRNTPEWVGQLVRNIDQAIQWITRAPAINGGTINKAVIGGITPAAGTFTTLTATTLTLAGLGVITSGTYTPTLFNTTNVQASTAFPCQYIRVGNAVIVSGRVDIDPTLAPLTNTVLGMSLPIASAFAQTYQCGGNGTSPGIASQNYSILGDTVNARATFQGMPTDGTSQPNYFNFMYLVV